MRRRDQLYHGPFLRLAPDFQVEFYDDPVLGGLAWERDGKPTISDQRLGYSRHPINGGHRKMGRVPGLMSANRGYLT